jgi:hypothetical protein
MHDGKNVPLLTVAASQSLRVPSLACHATHGVCDSSPSSRTLRHQAGALSLAEMLYRAHDDSAFKALKACFKHGDSPALRDTMLQS